MEPTADEPGEAREWRLEADDAPGAPPKPLPRGMRTPAELVAEAERQATARRLDDERWLRRRFIYRAWSTAACALFAGLYAWFMCGGSWPAGLGDALAAGACAAVVLRWSLSPLWSLALATAAIIGLGFGLGSLLPAALQEFAFGLRWPFASMGLIIASLGLSLIMELHE